jgi:HD-GYP domain-containing protein (c-di-GMP phosphodiesterase class II)
MDWMTHGADLETRLSVLLLSPRQQPQWLADLKQVQAELGSLLQADADGALYSLLQIAATTTVGYSTSHAMVCASLCHLVAPVLGLQRVQQDSLTLAALTMNIAMTRLQDDLALQSDAPTPDQRRLVDVHPLAGAHLLRDLGVQDPFWLHTVEHHHDPDSADLLTRVLMATDRYAALLSPRETRPGRCVTDSARSVIAYKRDALDEVGHALVSTVGICPPGTFVRLEDGRTAIVLRRSRQPGTPWVAPVLDAEEHPIPNPELVNTANEGLGIEAALVPKSVRVRLNHTRMAQLSKQAAIAP